MPTPVSILLVSLAVAFGCATRSVPAVSATGTALNPNAATAPLRTPTALDGEADHSEAHSDDDHSKHDHSRHATSSEPGQCTECAMNLEPAQ